LCRLIDEGLVKEWVECEAQAGSVLDLRALLLPYLYFLFRKPEQYTALRRIDDGNRQNIARP